MAAPQHSLSWSSTGEYHPRPISVQLNMWLHFRAWTPTCRARYKGDGAEREEWPGFIERNQVRILSWAYPRAQDVEATVQPKHTCTDLQCKKSGKKCHGSGAEGPGCWRKPQSLHASKAHLGLTDGYCAPLLKAGAQRFWLGEVQPSSSRQRLKKPPAVALCTKSSSMLLCQSRPLINIIPWK